MTVPPDLSGIIPKKYKTYIALVGGALGFLVPFILEATEGLPAPWPAVIGAVVWLLTAFGVYQAPYKPEGTVLVPQDVVKPEVRDQYFRNPWR